MVVLRLGSKRRTELGLVMAITGGIRIVTVPGGRYHPLRLENGPPPALSGSSSSTNRGIEKGILEALFFVFEDYGVYQREEYAPLS